MARRPYRLSRHFVLSEFSDDHAGKLPPRESIPYLRFLCHRFLEPLREEFGVVIVNSGYRTPETNRYVGGATRSRHLYDIFHSTPAADVTARRGDAAAWGRFLEELSPGGLGVYPGHVHVDNRNVRARW